MDSHEDGPISLPEPSVDDLPSVGTVVAARRSRRSFTAEALSLDDLATLCWAVQGVTDPENGFRAAPSAGATYPLSVAVIVGEGGVEGLEAGIYRYRQAAHALVRRESGDVRDPLWDACLDQAWVKATPVSLVLLADPTPTAAQYGDRGRERYVPMEVGHAGQNLYLVAEALDLGTVAVGAFDDDAVGTVAGADDDESPMAVYPVGVPR
jgi:SagB-type dehydrogenase family enzyme